MHIYSDISYFVQFIVMIITMSLRFRDADVTSESLFGPLRSMKNKTFIQIMNGE